MSNTGLITWDSHLVARAKAGDQVAFELIVDTYRPALMSLAMRKLRSAEDAHDVVQETFIKAFKNLKDFDVERPIRPWLSRICMNCIVDVARQRKGNIENLDSVEYALSEGNTTEERAEGSFRRNQIMDALSKLPYRYRQIIIMRHFEHLDVMEIAAKLDKPEGTIKSWLFRARALLAKDPVLAAYA